MQNKPAIAYLVLPADGEFTLGINGDTYTYTADKEGKRQAILDCLGYIETTAVGNDTYLPASIALEVVAEVLYPGGIQDDRQYKATVVTTDKACAHLGYGSEVELGPPAVPFSVRGSYRKKYPPVDPTLVNDKLEIAGTSSTSPRRELNCYTIYNEAGFEIYNRHWSLLNEGEQALIQAQVDEIAKNAGWQKDGEKFVQPLLIDREYARSRIDKFLRDNKGDPIAARRIVSEAQKGAYSRVFATYEMSEALATIVKEVLHTHGYDPVIKDGFYRPLPVTFTPEAETAVIANLTNLKIVATTHGPALLLSDILDLVKAHTEVEVITEWQAEDLITEGVICDQLKMLGYQPELTYCQAYDFESLDVKTAQEIVLKEVKVRNDAHTRVGLAKGFTVLAPVLTIDEEAKTIICLEMLGHKEAVKANWAALMGGGKSHWLDGVYVSVDGMKQHVKIQTTLPSCGWLNHVLLHKQASLQEMNPENPFYLLDDGSQQVPELFYVMLNKALSIPLMPAWVDYLWQNGREAKLIELMSEGKGQGYAAWRVKPVPEKWQQIVQNGLREEILTF